MIHLSHTAHRILIVTLVSVVVLVMIVLALFAPRSTPVVPPTNPPAAVPVNVVTTDEPISETEYPYVGVRQDDTLAVANDEKIVVISLDHRNWQAPRWSPDGKFILALGTPDPQSTDVIYDLYVYELANNSWERITFFGDNGSGITGIAWRQDNTIVFTQGEGEDNWLHTYNLESGEIRKIIQVDGALTQYIPESGIYVITTDVGSMTDPDLCIQLIKGDATVLQTFTGSQVTADVRITDFNIGRSESEFLFEIAQNESIVFYSWDFNDPQFRLQELTENQPEITDEDALDESAIIPAKLSYFPICARDESFMWSYTYAADLKRLDLINFKLAAEDEAGSYEVLTKLENPVVIIVDDRRIFCTDAKALMPVRSTVNDEQVTQWYLIEDDTLSKLSLLQDFSEAAVR
jgi:hypothetical protein